MKTLYLILLLCLFQRAASCQFIDDFNDEKLMDWYGDTADFRIDTIQQLQLTAQSGVLSSIHRQVNSFIDTSWSGRVKLDFSPSNSNQLRIQLASTYFPDTIHYGLQIGESGIDSLYFYEEKKGETEYYQISIPFDKSVEFYYQINYEKGSWQFQISRPDQSFTLDTLHLPSEFSLPHVFSIQCRYTRTRSKSFYFDQISCGQNYRDQLPPQMVSHELVDAQELFILFDEKIKLPITDHFHFDQGENTVSHIEYFSDSSEIKLKFQEPLDIAENYLLLFSIYDVNGNLTLDSIRLIFYPIKLASPGDILITEIMADPSPPKNLPECEYIEIYNASENYLNLSDYTLADDTKQVFLLDTILSPGDYLAVADRLCQEKFDEETNIIFVDALPAFNNDQDHVRILDYVGRELHSVDYDRSWYDQKNQEEGGWSLEMKDVSYPCLGKENWAAADFLTGGSPGMENSISQIISPGPLRIVRLDVQSESRLWIHFNQEIRWSDPTSELEFVPTLEIKHISKVSSRTIEVISQNEVTPGQSFTVILHHLFNCIGKEVLKLSKSFFVPVQPDPNEVKLNEILFNPYPGGSDFLELKNTGSQYVLLDEICLLHHSSTDTSLVCPDQNWVIPPRSPLAITRDTAELQSHYTCGRLVEFDLPSFPDTGGNIQVLLRKNGQLIKIDSFRYDEKLHHAALASREGVSLERLRNTQSRKDIRSWQSASSQVGYATPGLINSQLWPDEDDANQVINLSEDHFSPNQDGYLDFVVIRLNLPKPGFHARLQVFDHSGMLVATLLQDRTIAAEENLTWQGGSNDGGLTLPGMYIIQGQFAHPDGDLIRDKVSLTLE